MDRKGLRGLRPSVAMVYNDIENIWRSGFFITENLLVTVDPGLRELINRGRGVEKTLLRVYAPGKMDYGKILIRDISSDLVIIKTQRSDYTPLSLGRGSDIIRGERAMTIGYRDPYPSKRDIFSQKKGPVRNFMTDWIATRRRGVIEEGSVGMRIGNKAFHITSVPFFRSGGGPVFSQGLKVIGVVMTSSSLSQPPYALLATPVHQLKNLIGEGRELLQREGAVGFAHINSERVRERQLDFDVKTAEDMLIMRWAYKWGAGINGVSTDPQKSFYWLQRAAQQGHKRAQLHLAEEYFLGLSVRQDLGKARFWREKAGAIEVKNCIY